MKEVHLASNIDEKFVLKAVDQLSSKIDNVSQSFSKLERKLENVNRVAAKHKGLHALGEKMTKFGRGVTKLGKGMTTYVTAPIVGMGVGFVKAASDAEESENRFKQVFGKLSGQADEFAKKLGGSVGRSSVEIKEGITVYQQFAQGLGMSNEKAFEFSKKMQTLALDFASFNNVYDDEAQQRFISALSGSSEVLDKFGINTKSAALQQQILKMGLKSNVTKASELVKTVARLKIIEGVMGKNGAIGDAVRTQDSFNNQLKRLKSSTKDLAINLGNLLLPHALKLVKAVNSLVEKFSALSPEMQTTILKIAGIAAVVGPALLIIGKLITGFGLIATVIGKVGIGMFSLTGLIGVVVGGMVAGAIWVYKNWDKVKSFFSGLWESIGNFAGKVGSKLKKMWDGPLFKVLRFVTGIDLIISAGKRLIDNWGAIKNYFSNMWDQPIRSAMDFTNPIRTIVALAKIVKENWEPISGWFTEVWDGATKAFNNFISIVQQKLGAIGTILDFGLFGKSGELFSSSTVTNPDGSTSKNSLEKAVFSFMGAPSWTPPQSVNNTTVTKQESKLTIDFKNIPKGVNVLKDGNADMDLNLGYMGA